MSPDQSPSSLVTPQSSRVFPELERECKAPSTLYIMRLEQQEVLGSVLTPCAKFGCLCLGPTAEKLRERGVQERSVLLMYAETAQKRTSRGLSERYGPK